MKKTRDTVAEPKIAVDINGLREMLSIGETTARWIGEEAGAVIKIGRRKLYNVEKIKAYINDHCK